MQMMTLKLETWLTMTVASGFVETCATRTANVKAQTGTQSFTVLASVQRQPLLHRTNMEAAWVYMENLAAS